MVVGMVKIPLRSSTRTRSSPARALTAILAIDARLKLKLADPLSPTSIWRMPGLPASRRSGELVARFGAFDRQHAVRELRVLERVVRALLY
jgi:hypothetical protein